MPIRLGIIGMWHTHAAGLVSQIAAHPDEFQLVAGFDPEPQVVLQRQQVWQTLLPQFKWQTSAEAVLKEELDGVIVEGRVHENLKWAQLAIDSGRPVLLEKPGGNSFQPFETLLATAQRKNLHVQLIYLFRYMSAIQEILARAKRGDLGHIYEFRGRLPKDLANYDDFVRELSGYRGGIFFEMGGHLIDLMVALMGKPQAVTPFLAHHHTGSELGIERNFTDNGVAVFTLQKGWGIIEVPALETATHARRIEVYGTTGTCVLPHLGSGHLGNHQTQPLDVYSADRASWEHLDLPAATLQIRDLREFAAVITQQKSPDFSPEHDLIVHEALLRASGMWA
ncbi:MAG: Gfo/Idh/MocA family oxidoreductase [Planctomycetota bacterium]